MWKNIEYLFCFAFFGILKCKYFQKLKIKMFKSMNNAVLQMTELFWNKKIT